MISSSEAALTSCAIFDVDGTLVDTKDLVFRCYASAGVEMPDDAWGKPWNDWLIDYFDGDEAKARKAHKTKQATYLSTLDYTDLDALPPTNVAMTLHLAELATVGFLTGAMRAPALKILAGLGFDLANHAFGCGMNVHQKVSTLRLFAQRYRVMYVDDDPDVCTLMRETIPEVHVLHYSTQTFDQLMEDVDAWTP